jgi:two-component system nitrogen regulation response regulator GlnG
LESELFGHEQGAFTGADRRRIGKFEQCDGATLFLDEVGDLSPSLQAKLLRVLQDRSFHRVGSNQELQTDVRIIAATNRNLEHMVEEGSFRRDLYFRLANFTIPLPPLRERPDDLPALVDHIVSRLNQQLGTEIRVVPEETLAVLARSAWPGNVRELENCLRTSLIHATGQVLLPEFLAETGVEPRGEFTPDADPDNFRKLVLELLARGETGIYSHMVRRLDALVLHLVMDHTCGNQVQASRLLGITRSTLRAKLQSLAAEEQPLAECRL